MKYIWLYDYILLLSQANNDKMRKSAILRLEIFQLIRFQLITWNLMLHDYVFILK